MKPNRWLCMFIPLLAALLLCATAGAQVTTSYYTGNGAWVPAGSGLPGRALASTVANDYLYVVHQTGESRWGGTWEGTDREYRISRWDGSAWQAMTTFTMSSSASSSFILGLREFNGSFYLAGNFYDINGDTRLGLLARWDGTTWSPARGSLKPNEFSVSALEIHNGELYAGMRLGWNIMNMKYRCAVVRWDGSDWRLVGLEISPWDRGNISTLRSWNGELYVAGYRLGEEEYSNEGMMRWDGNRWHPCSNGFHTQRERSVYNLVVFRGQLYASGKGFQSDRPGSNGIARWNGTSWQMNLPVPEFLSRSEQLIVHDDRLYMLSQFNNHSGTFGAHYERIGRFDGTSWEEITNTDGLHGFLASYKGSLILGGKFTESGGALISNVARFCGENECGKITGTVFNDANGNCIQDDGEQALARRFVEFAPGGHYAVTDDQGNYSRYLENGSYSISLRERPNWAVVCPAAPGSRQVTLSGNATVTGQDFGVRATAAIPDLRITAVSSRARAGRQITYVITYENIGTAPANGSVWFLHDPVLTFDSAQAAPSRYTAPLAEWKFKNLGIDERRTIHIWTTAPPTLPLGGDICAKMWIEEEQGVFSLDTRDSICVPVTASYDPNDIQVTPFGIGNNGVITPADSVLTYWVRFQNTGNDTAFKVVVLDTLGSQLDISSIKLGAASHPFSFSIDKSNVLSWTFNDIMLPDSNASEPNSHGFFKYSVKLKPGLPPGTRIANQAHIYFDYNAPVATNTVVSILGAPMSVEREASGNGLAIYPNPTRDRLTIGAELRAGAAVTLRTLLGETVRSYRHSGAGPMTVNLGDLPAGTYLLTAETAGGVRSERVTVVR